MNRLPLTPCLVATLLFGCGDGRHFDDERSTSDPGGGSGGASTASSDTPAGVTGGNLEMGQAVSVLGDWLRLVHWRNTGILFGMLPESGPAFAIVSMGVVGLIVVYHAKVGRGIVTSVALGLLLGGALGNLVDRLRYGSVVDFVDMGIGSARFYTYNVGDAAITTAIILLILMAVAPSVAEWGVDD